MTPTLEQFFAEHSEWEPFADLVVAPPEREEALEEFPELEGAEVLTRGQEYTRFRVTRLALYIKTRRSGSTHRFAEMIAMQRAPQIMTDDVFFAGARPWAADITPARRALLLRQAKAQGFTPPADAVYYPDLARFPGDKEAYVTRAMGRGYIKKKCEERGWACHGGVQAVAREPDVDPWEKCVPMAEDVIRQNAIRMIEKDPSLRRLKRKELRDMVLQKRGPST